MNFITIVLLAVIYCFLKDNDGENTDNIIIQQKNNPFNPNVYEIRHKK